MLYICVSTCDRKDGTHSARLCPIIEYSKPDRSGVFVNFNQGIWLSDSDAEFISVGDLKDIRYNFHDVKKEV